MKKYLLLAFIAASCHRIHEGEVIEKHIEPAHEYHWMSYHRIGKITLLIPHTDYTPERYALEIKGISGNDTITEKFYVPFWKYRCENCGQHFNDTLSCTRNDNR